MTDAPSSTGHVGPARVRRAGAHARPLMLRIAVIGCALAGAMALALVTGPVRPELFIAAAVAVGVAAVVYLVQPRAGAIAFLALGTAICVGCVVPLLTMGTVPWLLTGFWGGAATLLAGLLDLIGRDGTDSMVVATVVAVVSLLLLSALGLGQYVRVNWTAAERAMLEQVPRDVAEPDAGTARNAVYVQQAPQGRWVCRWLVRTRDVGKAWAAMRLAMESEGWRVHADEPGEELTAKKGGYELTIEARPAEVGAVETGGEAAPGATGAIEFVASLGAE